MRGKKMSAGMYLLMSFYYNQRGKHDLAALAAGLALELEHPDTCFCLYIYARSLTLAGVNHERAYQCMQQVWEVDTGVTLSVNMPYKTSTL